MMKASYTGGCACGAIRYDVSAEPLMAGHCQCRDCQRATGTGHASMMAFPEAAMKLTGAPKFHGVKADSGHIASRGFCPDCGSFVVAKSSGMPGMVTVAAGSLDDPGKYGPRMVIYTSRGHAWDHVDPTLPRFPTMPPMPPMPG